MPRAAPTAAPCPRLTYTVTGLIGTDTLSGALSSDVGNAGDIITANVGGYYNISQGIALATITTPSYSPAG